MSNRNNNLHLEARYADKTPTEDECQRLTITVGKMQVEIVALPGDTGLYIRLDQPFNTVLSVIPYANNAIKLEACKP